jgi:type VI secretion system FHA domain protein
MLLKLSVTHYRSRAVQSKVSVVFSEHGGTLGCSPDNDLVLDDPDHFISLIQGRIDRREDHYYLINTGINPYFVNNRLTEHGNETLLKNGDHLTIGDYRVEILVQSQVVAQEFDVLTQQGEMTVPPQNVLQSSGEHPSFLVLDTFEAVPLSLNAELPDALARSRILEDGSLHDNGILQTDPLGLNLVAGLFEMSSPTLNTVLEEQQVFSSQGKVAEHLFPASKASLLLPPTVESTISAAERIIPDDYDLLTGVHAPTGVQAFQAKLVTGDCKLVFHALLEGLGLSSLQPQGSPVKLAYLVGEMLREATAGTMQVLKRPVMDHRDNTQGTGEFENDSENPLISFIDPEGALTLMLSGEAANSMTPLAAYVDAFDLLKARELAAIACIRTTLKTVVQRLDPAGVEKLIGDSSVLDRLIPGRRKVRMWNQLVEQYDGHDVGEQAQRLFEKLFSVGQNRFLIRHHDSP